jgi:hypothetical protein
MELSTVVWIVVLIVAAVLLMKLLGKVVSLALSVLGIVAVVWLVVIGLRYMDENNVRDNLLDSNNLFVLQDEGNFITGFATQEGMPDPEIDALDEDLTNPNSELYDEYYKVIVVEKDALPEKTALMVDASGKEDKLELFRYYVENSLLEGDVVENLVEEEKEGSLQVYKETLAFKHGVKEVLGS